MAIKLSFNLNYFKNSLKKTNIFTVQDTSTKKYMLHVTDFR